MQLLPDPNVIDAAAHMASSVTNGQLILPWDNLLQILLLIVVLAFFVERILSVLFETFLYLSVHQKLANIGIKSTKTLISILLSMLITSLYQIDIFAITLAQSQVSIFGCVLTGFVVAGGSKASLKLFRDVLGVHSNAYSEYRATKTQSKPAQADK